MNLPSFILILPSINTTSNNPEAGFHLQRIIQKIPNKARHQNENIVQQLGVIRSELQAIQKYVQSNINSNESFECGMSGWSSEHHWGSHQGSIRIGATQQKGQSPRVGRIQLALGISPK
jgi:hypothetical protein